MLMEGEGLGLILTLPIHFVPVVCSILHYRPRWENSCACLTCPTLPATPGAWKGDYSSEFHFHAYYCDSTVGFHYIPHSPPHVRSHHLWPSGGRRRKFWKEGE